MGRALASPAASTADSPAAPRTPTSCRQSSDQHRTAVPPPACLNPQSEPHVVPSRRVPRPSSLALARVRQRLSHCRIFTPAQPNHSVASSEGFLLRRLHIDDFREKVKSSMLSLQRNPDKIRSFFHKPSLKYAA